VFPARRGVAIALAWTGLALLSVAVTPFAPALALAAVLGLAVAAWDAAVLWRLVGPSLSRELPQRAVIRREAEIALAIASADPIPLRIDVFEELPRDLADADPEFRDLALGAGAALRVTYRVRPAQRGTRPLGHVAMLVRTRLGIAQRRFAFPADALRVHPDTSGLLRREALDPKRLLAAIGVKRARPRGSGLEFETLREYVAGDDVRHIDWRATARRGRTMTRIYRHERDHPVVLAIDASRLMGASCGRATTLDFAIEAALALAYTALHHGDRVGLCLFDTELRAVVAPRRSRRALGRVIDAVWDVQPRLVEPDYARLAGHLARRQRQRALIVLLTDFAHAGALAVLEPLAVLARQHRLLLVALRNPLLDTVARGDRSADPLERYRRLVVDDLLHERGVALAALRRRGVQTLDLAPDEVTPPLLNRYLALRFGES
jgi:uncharacterized protein (DUF58 family)